MFVFCAILPKYRDFNKTYVKSFCFSARKDKQKMCRVDSSFLKKELKKTFSQKMNEADKSKWVIEERAKQRHAENTVKQNLIRAKDHTKQNPAVPQMELQEKLSNVVEFDKQLKEFEEGDKKFNDLGSKKDSFDRSNPRGENS